ncbi:MULTISPECIES: DUF7475 family protein [Caldilinea]|jgi:hypothetical protein|uniref:Uncharacterized protein n=1 Tax=Caldilinea aerophila TaxID=133453 RepID=A0A7C1FHR2_9CHLR|nr:MULTISPECIES: hypothetical protein [Caldilinea]MBO9393270.1 hypothetical protein [Caldilinea sp.]GIV73335.1 MAG: hypothetical protein KatS3mg049_1891 [Caldilinea sp.]
MNASSRLSFTQIQWGIIVLTVITAVIHIWLGVGFLDSGGLLFVLNGLGYLGLLVLLLAPIAALNPYRTWIRWVLIAYTAVTVIAWVFIGTRSMVAYIDKIVEVALIVLLWLDGQRQR